MNRLLTPWQRILFVMVVVLSVSATAWAIDGPGVTVIPNANWGGAGDIWPHVVRVEIDDNKDGTFGNDNPSPCTGTLVAPDAVITAGHCFDDVAMMDNSIPAGTVRFNFGPQAATQYISNAGGHRHAASGDNDFAILSLASAAPVSPIPILPRPARVNDTNFAIGYGSDPDNNKMNAARVQVTNGGFSEHSAGAKNWSTITVDNVTGMPNANGNFINGFVEQFIASPEDWTEGGDSGGPGIQRILTMPDRAWGASIGALQKGDFVMSTVSGGPTPTTNDSSAAANVTYPANPAGNPDQWVRVDAERNFIDANAPSSMSPFSVEIHHNLPDDVAGIQAGDMIAVFTRATYTSPHYLLHINVWEEDNQATAAPFNFNGDVALGHKDFFDDMAGFGFSAGSFAMPVGLTNDVVAWDIRPASAIVPFDEAGNALDPPLDWVFQVNYGDANQFNNSSANVTKTDFDGVMQQIAMAQMDIAGMKAVRGGFALVPEPGTLAILLTGAMCWAIWTKRRR